MNQSPINDSLDDLLTAQATNPPPEFSQQLHRRIMQRVADASARQSRPTRHTWFIIPAAMAAAAAVAIGLTLWMHHEKPSGVLPGRLVIARTMPSIPTIQNPVRALDEPAISNWTTASYAGVDRDGQKLLGYMARQLDVLPESQKR